MPRQKKDAHPISIKMDKATFYRLIQNERFDLLMKYAEIDAAENIKPSKKKSTEKIDGIVAWIMGLDRAIRHEQQGSVYDDPEHGLWIF